ncbi:hypothetical protein [Falsirhodobacter algicola]|uniref:hypothetical protein n=1 Tax=Falsirhodobacter algicola TaxID=2692330 RepID=UPI001BA819A5|nr:hypothetical protein [Falsirhodobacter algicola]
MTDDSRLKHYTEIDRKQAPEGSHPATAALHRRPVERDDENRRAREYARIERGHET